LVGAKNWYRFLINEVGFQGSGDGLLAINYFANVAGGLVPNNTTLTLLTLAKLPDATNDDQYLGLCGGMIAWLSQVQLQDGELPYAVEGSEGEGRRHYLCYQYNAFELLDLAQYYRITGDQAVWPILERLAAYLSRGISKSGAARYDYHRERPEMPYHTAAVAAALSQATVLGLGSFRSLVDRACGRVMSRQRADGAIEFSSRGNCGFLADRRSYPRYLSMILYHLLLELEADADQSANDNSVESR